MFTGFLNHQQASPSEYCRMFFFCSRNGYFKHHSSGRWTLCLFPFLGGSNRFGFFWRPFTAGWSPKWWSRIRGIMVLFNARSIQNSGLRISHNKFCLDYRQHIYFQFYTLLSWFRICRFKTCFALLWLLGIHRPGSRRPGSMENSQLLTV